MKDKYKDVPVWKRPPRTSPVLKLFLILLLLCCGVLLIRLYMLDRALADKTMQVAQLESEIEEQRAQVNELLKNTLQSELVLELKEETVGKPQQQQSVSQGDAGAEQQEENVQKTEEATEEHNAAHKVYLTFDDGPSIYTDDILDILAEYQVKATFFVVGKEEGFTEEMLQRIVDEGHTLGLHSYSHKYDELYESVEAFKADFRKIQEAVYKATGHRSYVYRFPGGSSNQVSDVDMMEFVECLKTEEVQFYDWNLSAGDGGSVLLDADTIVDNCTKGITGRRTTIVLMHDSADKSTTVEALPRIIEKILAMEDTAILPITEETAPMHHIDTEAAGSTETTSSTASNSAETTSSTATADSKKTANNTNKLNSTNASTDMEETD